MIKPSLRKFKRPEHISGYPTGPCYDAGHLVSVNAGWRTEKPQIDTEKCSGCHYCYLCCPEGVIYKDGDKIGIDFDFCKGCGICARVCKRKAILMVREEK